MATIKYDSKKGLVSIEGTVPQIKAGLTMIIRTLMQDDPEHFSKEDIMDIVNTSEMTEEAINEAVRKKFTEMLLSGKDSGKIAEIISGILNADNDEEGDKS